MLSMLSMAVDALKYLFGRPSLHVRVFEDDEKAELGGLKFEIENVGSRPTSLRPQIKLSYWVPQGPRIIRQNAIYDISDVDRELPPFRARVFAATARRLHHNYSFSWFRSYLFRTTTGHWTRAHVRHALLDPLNMWQYWWEIGRLVTRRKLSAGAASISVDRMALDRRSRGPL